MPRTEPTVENLRRASKAIYLACDPIVAEDVSNLLTWAADEIERLRRVRMKSDDDV